MFKIITYKKLAICCAVVCVLLIAGSFFSTSAPLIQAAASGSVKIPVLMYHHISENKKIWGKYVIPQNLLESDFKYMQQNGWTPVSFKDLALYCSSKGTLPKKPIIITFDDGERSFLTKAVPLIEKYNYPATVSVVGSLIDLYTENGDTDDRYAYLNWEDIKTLSKNDLVTIGNHSYNMHSLGLRRGMGKLNSETDAAYIDAVKADIEKLQTKLLNNAGVTPYVMAYPFGIRNDALMTLCKSEGFSVTLTCRESVNELSPGDTLYELGRFNRPYGVTSETFFEKFK